MKLDFSIRSLHGIGPKTAEVFESRGISTIEDLLYFFPRAWIDATRVTPLSQLRSGMAGLIDVQVALVKQGMSQRTRLPYLRATVADETGSMDVMWFHANYLKNKVKPGEKMLLYGRVHPYQAGGRMIMSPKFMTQPSIVPIYSEIGGLTSAKIKSVFDQLKELAQTVPDFLPEDIRQREGLLSTAETLAAMHFPESIDAIAQAKKRLAFDELLILMFPTMLAHHERGQETTASLVADQAKINAWIASLPFDFTDDQTTVTQEILSDLAQTKPMNRLLQGDVGSGKTVVGLAAVLQSILSGKQVIWLAPTELLAQQHFATAKKLLASADIPNLSIGLLTRTSHLLNNKHAEEKASKADVLQANLIIGTHALLSEGTQFDNLGLLIIDEQHRFGVKQRAQLRVLSGRPIHLLSMTATPIPRTMALLLYGDLRLSVIKQKPVGRKPITTRIVTEDNRPKAYQFIDAHIHNGGQVYVICPTIEPAKDDEANVFNQLFETIEEKKAVLVWHDVLKKVFPLRRLAMLHGKLRPADKIIIMEEFREGKIDILVSTTVVEVGVDVPNANIMMIEDADRFGLAQLHQLRGRVGRGERQSFCLLFPSSAKKAENERLKIVEQSDDGFVLAEKDLELRGPGELTGLAQSGLPTLRFASLQDTAAVERVKQVAETLFDNATFRASLDRFWRIYHPE